MSLIRCLAQYLVLAFLIRNSCFALQELSGREIYQKQCARCHDNFSETGALSPILLRKLSSERILAALESGRMKDQGALLTQAQRHIVALYLSARRVNAKNQDGRADAAVQPKPLETETNVRKGELEAFLCDGTDLARPHDLPVLRKENIENLLSAWSSMEMSRIGAYYSPAFRVPGSDLSPGQYTGSATCIAGSDRRLSDYKSFNLKLVNEPRIRSCGNRAWSTYGWRLEAETKDHTLEIFNGSEATTWELQEDRWTIIEDKITPQRCECSAAPSKVK